MVRVWPDVTVDEGSLRFHVVALRKALEQDSAERFIFTVPGTEHGFVGALSEETISSATAVPRAAEADLTPTLPLRPQGVVGRDQILRTLSERLLARRFVSVVKPGSIGKTTVALCVLHDLASHCDGAVYFVDLSRVGDPALAPGEIAASVGLRQSSEAPTDGLIELLRNKRALLLLENCEHVIGAAAEVTERLVRDAKLVHILVTSREPLQVEGERVQRLFPLDYPAADLTPTAEQVINIQPCNNLSSA